MIRRTQTIYVTVDPFLSPRGAVLHHFDQLLEGLSEAQFPCIWLTSLTRAQLDEPRRRLGHDGPFIGESGCGVYRPEDYFHLKAGNTIRLGRFTCIPVAKPRPAASEALEELSNDLSIATVSLRTLSPRELSQNTGLPAGEAEQIRMRDFDELFFFAGASDGEIAKFAEESKVRGLVLQNAGAFWSLSVGADYAKCIRELGGLYDRALRAHALRVGIAVAPGTDLKEAAKKDPRVKSLAASCDRTFLVTEWQPGAASKSHFEAASMESSESSHDPSLVSADAAPSRASAENRSANSFHLQSPDLWD